MDMHNRTHHTVNTIPGMATFSTAEVCRATGASYRQVDYWTRCGYVTPSVNVGHGSGRRRRWSHGDIAEVAELVDAAHRRDMWRSPVMSVPA